VKREKDVVSWNVVRHLRSEEVKGKGEERG